VQRGELSRAAITYDAAEHVPPTENELLGEPAARLTARAEGGQLRLRLATLTFHFNGGAPASESVWVDDINIDTRIARLVIDAGPHVLRVRRGTQESRVGMDVADGE